MLQCSHLWCATEGSKINKEEIKKEMSPEGEAMNQHCIKGQSGFLEAFTAKTLGNQNWLG